MRKSDFLNFSEIFSDVVANRGNDPIEHILVLTYEFDDQQLINLLTGRTLEDDFELKQTHLKLLSDIRPVVIYDARKTKPFSSLPQFLELHPYKTSGFTCHHSKAYLVITRKTVRLTLGSFNLTYTGLFKNREVLETYIWTNDKKESIHILQEWILFLKTSYENGLTESSKDALKAIINRLNIYDEVTNESDKNKSHLIFSGYNSNNGLDKLEYYWNIWSPNKDVNQLWVVSPFFDINPKKSSCASNFIIKFPKIKTLNVITDYDVKQGLSKFHFGKFEGKKGLFLIPADISKDERDFIEKQSGKSTTGQVISRNLHAKIIVLSNGNEGLIYMGSANFSNKAWMGGNQELGVCWFVKNPAEIIKSIVKTMTIDLKKNIYENLPELPELLTDVDDEGYKEDKLFPDFIEQVYLILDDTGNFVYFKFMFVKNNDNKLAISDYKIEWAGLKIEVNNNTSQHIKISKFQNRLVGGRNLKFIPCSAPEKPYWYPFQYKDNVISEREVLLLPTSKDWMEFYLNPNKNGIPNDIGETPSDDEDEDDKPTVYDKTGRDKNVVVAMQLYLNLFTKIENNFINTAININKTVNLKYQKSTYKNQIITPLSSFFKLLKQESENSKYIQLFKIGELLLLLKQLQKDAKQSVRTEFNNLINECKKFLKNEKKLDDIMKNYIKYTCSKGNE